MYLYNNKKNINKNGFTLVETLFAVSIFSIALVGLMSVLGKGISDTNYAKNKIIASYLAQEGIEYVRNMRDTYVLYDDTTNSSIGWTDFLAKMGSGSCGSGSGCGFDDSLNIYNISRLQNDSNLFFNCDSGGCILKYNPSDGKYKYAQFSPLGNTSGFSRKINYSLVDAVNNEIKITSTVSWSKGGFTRSVVFVTNLTKWVE